MIYEEIKKLADEMGVTIYRIEKDCKLSNGIIGKWGKTANQKPRAENLKKVADYLDVSMEDLMGKDKQKA
jgi:transcriptional regulator with XRE-family HTH domain